MVAWLLVASIVGVAVAWWIGTAAGDGDTCWPAGLRAHSGVCRLDMDCRVREWTASALPRMQHSKGAPPRSATAIVVFASVASLGGVGYLLIAESSSGRRAVVATGVGVLSVKTPSSVIRMHTLAMLSLRPALLLRPAGRDRLQPRRPYLIGRVRISGLHHRHGVSGIRRRAIQSTPIRVITLASGAGVVPARRGGGWLPGQLDHRKLGSAELRQSDFVVPFGKRSAGRPPTAKMKLGGSFGPNSISGAVPDLINAAVTGTFEHNTWLSPVGTRASRRCGRMEQARPVPWCRSSRKGGGVDTA